MGGVGDSRSCDFGRGLARQCDERSKIPSMRVPQLGRFLMVFRRESQTDTSELQSENGHTPLMYRIWLAKPAANLSMTGRFVDIVDLALRIFTANLTHLVLKIQGAEPGAKMALILGPEGAAPVSRGAKEAQNCTSAPSLRATQ